VNNPAAASLAHPQSQGRGLRVGKQLTCYAPEWASVNCLDKEFSRTDYMTIPNEYFDDIRGLRTGLQERDTSRMSLRGDTGLDRRYCSGLVDCACVAMREKLQSLH